MTGDLRIRDAHALDLSKILLLYETSGIDAPGDNDPAAAPGLWQALRQAGGVVLIAERDGLALGTLTLFVLPLLAHGGRPGALVEDVAVHPQAQGLGVGRALMQAAMDRARQAGCYKLALSSNASRLGAHAFYDRLGFQRHGISFSVHLDAGPAVHDVAQGASNDPR